MTYGNNSGSSWAGKEGMQIGIPEVRNWKSVGGRAMAKMDRRIIENAPSCLAFAVVLGDILLRTAC